MNLCIYFIIVHENYFIRYEVIEIVIGCVLIRWYEEIVKSKMIGPSKRNDFKNMSITWYLYFQGKFYYDFGKFFKKYINILLKLIC
jgi:hypothetical protein